MLMHNRAQPYRVPVQVILPALLKDMVHAVAVVPSVVAPNYRQILDVVVRQDNVAEIIAETFQLGVLAQILMVKNGV